MRAPIKKSFLRRKYLMIGLPSDTSEACVGAIAGVVSLLSAAAFYRLFTRSGPRKLRLRSFSDSPEDRMDIHRIARLTLHGRERIVRQVVSGQTPKAVALAAGVCPRTIRKWVARYRAEGVAGLHDRSSRPHRLRQPTQDDVMGQIGRLRRQRWTASRSRPRSASRLPLSGAFCVGWA